MNITGKIVTLKPLQKKFFTEYHNMFSSTVRTILGLVPVCPLQETVDFLSAALVDKQELMFYCIFDNQTNKLIGAINIRSLDHPKSISHLIYQKLLILSLHLSKKIMCAVCAHTKNLGLLLSRKVHVKIKSTARVKKPKKLF